MPPAAPMTFLPGVPALHLVPSDDGDGRSHWGGRPRVPDGWAWPAREDGTPLSFLGQLDLAQVQAAGAMAHLPTTGTLLFFYDTDDQPWGFDPKDRDGWKVEYFPADTALSEFAGEPGGEVWHEVSIGFKPIETYEDGYPGIVGNDEPDDDTLDAAHELVQERNFGDHAHHQIGGHPDAIQNSEMGAECELVSHRVNAGSPEGYQSPRGQALLNGGGAQEWKLVLQVDTDDEIKGPGWMWGDCGMLYFWVKEEAGRAGDFSNAWLVLQCC